MSSRRRFGFVLATLLAFALVAGWVTSWAPGPASPSVKDLPSVTRSPGETSPPAVALADLQGVEDLRARFNADQGVPRLLLLLSPT
ncbi:MAG TPA: hypothetical protein VG276_14920 [Actinomycetes bacterium]|jgi:hypothetical protein|nr:hypothetical protein [Actinomycetes bacterium]